ncbi:hypothetical protein [Coleofasciculus sp. G2-EDA-02]|uniref:hypothetical protein n=1 Tax=Coleofasciculus sp. G2-EDA-02 TaxID=3069529 RepID=UPI0033054D48
MRPDLQGLEITPGELKHLSGVSVHTLLKPPTLPKFIAEIAKTLLIILLISLTGFVLIQVFPEHLKLLISVPSILAITLFLNDIRKIAISRKCRNLVRLFEDVNRFNRVIKAIDINDKIEAVGNPGVRLKNRGQVIQALRLTRDDIIRALKTERILRENAKFIKYNSELFDNNLMALTALQVSDQATEHGRLLNEALQIVVDVRQEMKALQNRHL